MLRLLVATLFIAGPVYAADFSIRKADEFLDEALLACNDGMNHDGETIAADVQLRACRDAVQLLIEISTNGYCYNEANDGWRECKVSND